MGKRRRRPGPDNPAQWIGQPYMPEDPSYLLGMGKGIFRYLPFPWVPFKRPKGRPAKPGGQRNRQRSGLQHTDVAMPGLPSISKHSKRPAPIQAMPLISNPWEAHEPYYDPTEKHTRLGLAMIRLAATYPKSSCLVSALVASALITAWVGLIVLALRQSDDQANLWMLLAISLLFGPLLIGSMLALRKPLITSLRARPRLRRRSFWRRWRLLFRGK